jgi:predicted helicase
LSETVLREYLGKVERDYKRGIATEHSYRGTLKDLLETLNSSITATNEPKRIQCGAPDYVIERSKGSNAFTTGYVEAKDVGKSLDEIERDARLNEPKTTEGKQLKRYLHALDNLVFTNYLEFRWYVQGEKRASANLSTSQSDKRLPFDREKAKEVAQLLHNFLEHSVEPVRNPPELAKRMARLAHMIRDIIIDAFEQRAASEELRDLYSAFKEVLLPELTGAEFADMFAQTLAYGLFAARYNHRGTKPFNRNDAAKEIPRTNPFLRRLFGTIAGPELDDEPFAGFVDDLAQLLVLTDMEAVLADFGKHTRQEDPIVHFYETFLAQYDPRMRELRGVYYTPEPVVSYIVRSIDSLLRTHFDCPDGLGDDSTISYTYVDELGETRSATSPRVLLLDPACGTGTFLYYVIEHIRDSFRQSNNAGMWSGYVREQLLPRLFGFELLMAPYAMAHLKLGMQLAAADLPAAERATWAYDFQSDERLGIYLTNTLEEAMKRSEIMFGRFISDEANEAAKVKQERPVMVVLGNPPYSNFGMMNKSPWILGLLKDYKKDLNEKKINLDDDFIKFIRFGQWRIDQTGYGILAFITNNTYIDGITHRRMRQSLMETFTDIYILDLHGSSKKLERSLDGSKDENVFDIQQGVSIGIFIKRKGKKGTTKINHAELWGSRKKKYAKLLETDLLTTQWTGLEPEPKHCFFVPKDFNLEAEYSSASSLSNIFQVLGNGLKTDRDDLFFDFDRETLEKRFKTFYSEAWMDPSFRDSYRIENSSSYDLLGQRMKTSFNSKNIHECLYRPFDHKWLYYTPGLTSRPAWAVMQHMLEHKNIALLSCRQQAEVGFQHIFCSRIITECCAVSLKTREITSVSPLYLDPDPKKDTLFDTDEPTKAPGGRRPNLSPAFISDIANRLNMQFVPDGKGDLCTTFGPEDIFHYMYAVFHSPAYRERYAEFLKIDFPRLPLTSNVELFRALCGPGERLVGLHLMEKFGQAVPGFPIKGDDRVEKVEYTPPADAPEQRLGRVWINKTQYFEGVAPAVWEFHVGGYQVCQKWLKDRKGRELTNSDKRHYQRIVAALAETITLMEQVDAAIDRCGGWPVE